MFENQPIRKTRLCVVGLGHWGRNHVRNFHLLDQLYAICDSSSSVLSTFQRTYPQARLFQSFRDVLSDPDIEAVVLATPAGAHHRMAMGALSAGKHVLVEKPLALSWHEGVEMVEEARRHGLVLMVGHLLRYHPAVLRMQELISGGTLGRIEYIYSNRLSLGKIRREENALWSFAPHDISLILALTGQFPIQVTATGGAYLQPNVADVTLSTLLFENGTRAHIFVSWLHPYKEQRLVVVGEKAMLVFEDTRPDHKLLLYDKRIEMVEGQLVAGKTQSMPVDFNDEEPLRQECTHFLECLASGREPLTPGEEGVHVLQVLQACQRSLQLNGEPVQMDSTRTQRISVL